MEKVFGEWALDINFNKLQETVIRALIHKPFPLTSKKLRFIRKFLEMTMTHFGKLFGVTHVAVVKWENEQSHINPTTEMYIHLYVLDHLNAKDKEFRKLYKEIIIESLIKYRKYMDAVEPIKIDVQDNLMLMAS